MKGAATDRHAFKTARECAGGEKGRGRRRQDLPYVGSQRGAARVGARAGHRTYVASHASISTAERAVTVDSTATAPPRPALHSLNRQWAMFKVG
jgi:hypothetical protein